jgi:hypothetical protein
MNTVVLLIMQVPLDVTLLAITHTVAPEVLTGESSYEKSVDLWSVGN